MKLLMTLLMALGLSVPAKAQNPQSIYDFTV